MTFLLELCIFPAFVAAEPGMRDVRQELAIAALACDAVVRGLAALTSMISPPDRALLAFLRAVALMRYFRREILSAVLTLPDNIGEF